MLLYRVKLNYFCNDSLYSTLFMVAIKYIIIYLMNSNL